MHFFCQHHSNVSFSLYQEWAQALRRISSLRPIILFPGHGPPLWGEKRIHEALSDSAQLLESICSQTVALMNRGLPLSRVMGEIEIDLSMLQKPFLSPNYDDPRFICATIFRQFGGWYTQEITRLLPQSKSLVAAELCRAAGGGKMLANRAHQIFSSREIASSREFLSPKWKSCMESLGVALELAEFAYLANDSDREISRIRNTILREIANMQ